MAVNVTQTATVTLLSTLQFVGNPIRGHSSLPVTQVVQREPSLILATTSVKLYLRTVPVFLTLRMALTLAQPLRVRVPLAVNKSCTPF